MAFRRLLLGAALIALTAVNYASAAQLVNKILAVVGDQVITLGEVDARLSKQIAAMRSSLSGDELKKSLYELRKEALHHMINGRLAELEANKLGIKVAPEEIEQAAEHVAATNNMTRRQFELALAREGITWDRFKDQIREQLLNTRLVYSQVKPKLVVSEEEKRKLYEERKDKYKAVTRVKLARIILPTGQVDLAKELVAKSRKGADFALLAKDNSIGPSAKDGGLLGTFEMNQLSPVIQEALTGLDQGGVSDPVEIDDRLQIFKVETKETTPGLTYEQAESALNEELTQKELNRKYLEWIQKIRDKSFVKVMNFEDE